MESPDSGTGSGHAVATDAINIRDGSANAGYDVNGIVYAELDAYSDAAIFVIGRTGGEGGDLTQSMEGN